MTRQPGPMVSCPHYVSLCLSRSSSLSASGLSATREKCCCRAAAAAAAAREKSAAAALPRCCCRAAALLLLPPLLWLPLPLLRHATINAAASCVTTAVWGSRATSRGCLGQRLHSLVACLPDVRVDGVPACAWAIAKKSDAPTALGMSRRGARLASATSLSYRRAPRGQLMSRLRAVACAGMEQM